MAFCHIDKTTFRILFFYCRLTLHVFWERKFASELMNHRTAFVSMKSGLNSDNYEKQSQQSNH